MRRIRTVAGVALALLAVAGVAYLVTARAGREGRMPAAAKAGISVAAATPATRGAGAQRVTDPTRSLADATPAIPDRKTEDRRQDRNEPSSGEDRGREMPPVGGPGAASDAPVPVEMPESEILARIKAGEPGFEVLASRLQLGTDRIVPRWGEGDAWLVETYYRQMQAANEVWSGPALWRFQVQREVGFRDRPCWEFVVARADDAAYPPAVYYVTRDSYRLAGSQTTVAQQGKTRSVTYIPDDAGDEGPQGVKAPLSIVPFDLPPVGAEARVTPPGLAAEPPFIEGRGRDRMPKADDLVGAGAGYLELEYANPIDRTRIHQRWSREDMRWPVVSRTETTWSYRRKE